ncbi:hypothetical protein CPter291_5113 [Collimonas pratensis]|uniref:Uncharacterized protein n=1 Tax=Collimonas pratensis TaxID=279113 RepID=A0ABM5ZEA5_9BURK|nr:hypothetical protein CPter291_5113 [Collimonas pratensis]
MRSAQCKFAGRHKSPDFVNNCGPQPGLEIKLKNRPDSGHAAVQYCSIRIEQYAVAQRNCNGKWTTSLC